MKNFYQNLKSFFSGEGVKTIKETTSLLAEVRETLTNQEEEIKQLKRREEEYLSKIQNLEQKEQDREDKKNSKEPWVVLTAAEYDETGGFKIELDWNDAFIKQLKDNGIDGPTDDFIIQKWLAFLYEDIVQQLDSKNQQDKQEGKVVSDYQ